MDTTRIKEVLKAEKVAKSQIPDDNTLQHVFDEAYLDIQAHWQPNTDSLFEESADSVADKQQFFTVQLIAATLNGDDKHISYSPIPDTAYNDISQHIAETMRAARLKKPRNSSQSKSDFTIKYDETNGYITVNNMPTSSKVTPDTNTDKMLHYIFKHPNTKLDIEALRADAHTDKHCTITFSALLNNIKLLKPVKKAFFPVRGKKLTLHNPVTAKRLSEVNLTAADITSALVEYKSN